MKYGTKRMNWEKRNEHIEHTKKIEKTREDDGEKKKYHRRYFKIPVWEDWVGKKTMLILFRNERFRQKQTSLSSTRAYLFNAVKKRYQGLNQGTEMKKKNKKSGGKKKGKPIKWIKIEIKMISTKIEMNMKNYNRKTKIIL